MSCIRIGSGARGLSRVASHLTTFLRGTGGCRIRGPVWGLTLGPLWSAWSRSPVGGRESALSPASTLGMVPGTSRAGWGMILEWYPISVSEDGYHPRVCSYRAPLSPVARQAPPYTQKRCGRVRSSAFRTLCLYHRSCWNGRWAGKTAGVICGPCSTCYPSVRTPGWCYEVFAVDRELAESFPTYPPTGWWRRTCCCPVAVTWECGAGAGPYGRGHRWRLRGPR